MNQSNLIQSNLDVLIPANILESCQLDRFDMTIIFRAAAVEGRWPRVRITVGDQQVIDKEINDQEEIKFSTRLDLSDYHFDIKIEYYGKTNKDTKLISGKISENQYVEIEKFIINDIDIIATNIIYSLGHYHMLLPKEKFEYFKLHGHETGPTHSLSMFENGYWLLVMRAPILTQFVKFKSKNEKHVIHWPNNELLNEIYDTILYIRKLEKQIKS
jgi:hypothetical protein